MGKLFEQIMCGEFDYPEEYWDDISDEGNWSALYSTKVSDIVQTTIAKDFIDNLLMVDTELRFTADQALEHPWLQVRIYSHILPISNIMYRVQLQTNNLVYQQKWRNTRIANSTNSCVRCVFLW